MKFRYLLTIVTVFALLAFWTFQLRPSKKIKPEEAGEKYSGPEQFALFHKSIRTPEGAIGPEYKPGYKVIEFEKAKAFAQAKRSNVRLQSNGVVEWTERGAANVPGRTRGLIVDPDDATKNTWFAGSVGGGVWKTTNAGQSWTWLTPNLPNLATTVLVMAQSNHDVIYLGTGEGFGNLDGVDGAGIFKSTNRGVSWNQLSSTMNFADINRIIVDPTNADVVLAATNDGIYRSINGGTDWTNVSNEVFIQDLKATSGNFNVQYAAQNGVGVLKSTDAGLTWNLSSTGMNLTGRVEIAISPVDPQRIFASAQGNATGSQFGSGNQSDLYISSDGGAVWSFVDVRINNVSVELLGDQTDDPNDDQGWYDNTIVCDPFDKDVVYVGGIDLFRIDVGSSATQVDNYSMIEGTSEFISLINFSAPHYGGRLEVGTIPEKFSVEIRFGTGQSQKAHQFQVPVGATSGVADANYSFVNYVEVPFEVWDITNNKQLMVSFRDQDRNGAFNLYEANTTSPTATEQSREYLFIHNIEYSETQNASIATNGGQTSSRKYFFWPVLVPGANWDPNNLPEATLTIQYSTLNLFTATTDFITDGRNRFGNPAKNQNLHVDHHNLVAIPMTASTFKILNANDGGVFISNTSATPGTSNGNWTGPTNGFNTSQFYGADKRPDKDEYIGGMQDNGTWKSPANVNASATTSYLFNLGGDGFEVIWNNLNSQLLIGGSQGNFFSRSTNGGSSWTNATSGLSGDQPFISKLANSKALPDRIFTLGSAGVFVSQNFGASWTLTPITDNWGGATSLMDVEVSRANANIVWAGSGMVSSGTLRNLHVSTNAGVSFSAAENSPLISGGITKLASHPFEENTAYALFSQAGNPKILRTEDLGQTWNDISGFNAGDVSTNGFPDVAVYCLYVRPDNPDIIWAGTEIGIVESLDNGVTWALIDDFPNVSVWDMKGQDDQVVIATHGRGIWTATIEAPQISVKVPEIIASGTSPKEKLVLKVNVKEDFDKIEFYDGTTLLSTLNDVDPSELVVTLNGLSPGNKNIKLVSFKGTAPFHSKTYSITQLDILSLETAYSTYFTSATDLTLKGFSLQNTSGVPTPQRKTMQTAHNYPNNADQTVILRHPVKVSPTFPMLFYSDIAIVEPGEVGSVFGTPEFKDFVVIEATKNGIDWIPLENGYNARANQTWLDAFNASETGNVDMFIDHEINLDDTFNAEDTLLIRYRLSANQTVNGWGAAVSFISIQQEPTATENPMPSGKKLNLFPNPTDGIVYAEFELTRASEVRAEIIDLFGRRVLSKKLGQRNAGTHQETFDLSNMLRGNYLMILETNRGNKIGKISVSR